MRRFAAAVIAASVAMIGFGDPSAAAPVLDQQGALAPSSSYSWTGTTATGFNYLYWDTAGRGEIGPVTYGNCDKSPLHYCDHILVRVDNPLSPEEIAAGKLIKRVNGTVTIGSFTPTDGAVTDFDLILFRSDAAGTVGSRVNYSAEVLAPEERVTFSVSTDVNKPSAYLLVRVVYYQVVEGSYRGEVVTGAAF